MGFRSKSVHIHQHDGFGKFRRSLAGDPPSPKQVELLEYIKDFRSRHGYSPSIREMQDHFGISSPNGINCHLRALKNKGLILIVKRMSRSVVPAGTTMFDVPDKHAGAVAAYLGTLEGAGK